MAADRSDDTGGGRSSKREETRNALLHAAGRLFAERGYHQTTVPEIVKAAGVGHGTFYEYFRSRRDILVALTNQAGEAAGRRPRLATKSLAERVRAEIYWYLFDHVEHIVLSKVWHDASNFDEEISEARRLARMARAERVKKGILAAGGRPGLDPDVAAAALTAMLEEFAHRWFVEGDGPGTSAADIVAASETLTTIWLAAIGAESPAPASAPEGV